jgi:hypothetical protein
MARKRGIVPSVDGLEVRSLLSGITFSLATDQTTYQMGQPIPFTFTATNTGSQPETFFDPSDFTVTRDKSLPIWQSDPSGAKGSMVTLQPGQSISHDGTWDGIPQVPGYSLADLTGTFTVAFLPAWGIPAEASTTFQVAAPSSWDVVSSIQADRSTYDSGQTMSLTFTETNEGSQPVLVVTGPDGFAQFGESESGPAYSSLPVGYSWSPSANAQWTTLPPGAPLTLTQSVPIGQYVLDQPYTMTIANAFDPNINTKDATLAPNPRAPGDPNTVLGVSFPLFVGDTYNGLPLGLTTNLGGPAIPATTETGPSDSGQDASAPLDSTSPGLVAAVSTGRSRYGLGQNVHIRVAVPGRGPSEAAMSRARPVEKITILDGDRVVARLARRIPVSKWKQAEAGRAVRVAKVWDGQPNQPGVRHLTSGDYTIDVTAGEYSGSTTVSLVRKRS